MRLAAPGSPRRAPGAAGMSVLRIISRTKLYWGLLTICLIGALASPHTSLGQEHLSLLRQPHRRAPPGVDHRPGGHRHDHRHPARRHRPVGRFGHGLFLDRLRDAAHQARLDGRRRHGRARGDAGQFRSRSRFLARFVFNGLARGRDVSAGQRREIVLGRMARLGAFPPCSACVVAVAVAWFTASQVPAKFGVLGDPAGDALRRR